MRGGEVEQAGAVGNVPAERLIFVRHHLRDAVELDIERAELLVLARDLVAHHRRILDDPGKSAEERVQVRSAILERRSAFPREGLNARPRLRIEEVHHLIEVDRRGGVLQREGAARRDHLATRRSRREFHERVTEQPLRSDGRAGAAMERGRAGADLHHYPRPALAWTVVGCDPDRDHFPDTGAVDHDIVLLSHAFGAQEVGGHCVGVVTEKGSGEPGEDPAHRDQHNQELHRPFPSCMSSRSARSCGAVGA